MTGLLSPEAVDIGDPRIQQLQAAAARKGVTLDLRPLRPSTRTPTVEQIASEVGCEVGQVVSSSLCLAPLPRGLWRPVVCMTAGRGEVEVRVATMREALDLFACSPGLMPAFGYGRDVSVVMDQDLGGCQWVWAPTGLASAVFRISPSTLRMLSNAIVAPVVMTSKVRSVEGFEGSAVLGFGAT